MSGVGAARRFGAAPKARQILIPRDIAVRPRKHHAPAHVQHLTGPTMGTSWSVKLAVPTDQPLRTIEKGILDQLDCVVSQMSTWLDCSTISRFNRAAAGTWIQLEPEFFTVLTAALELARSTHGAYDPTIGEAVNMWGFGPDAFSAMRPTDEQIAGSRARSGWAKIALDASRCHARQPGGAQLDLSSIAKGFSVDLIAAYLTKAGVDDFLVEVGGELRGAGCKPDGSPWWVELEAPPTPASSAAHLSETLLALHGLSVATSGDYRRRHIMGGDEVSHTLDPATGAPVVGPLASVSVAARECMTADALATALFVLGPSAGHDYAARHHIAARFIVRTETGLRQSMTPAMVAMLL